VIRESFSGDRENHSLIIEGIIPWWYSPKWRCWSPRNFFWSSWKLQYPIIKSSYSPYNLYTSPGTAANHAVSSY
jgi:hypothetical protein